MPEAPYAWAGSVEAFLEASEEEILQRLTAFTRDTGGPQLFAWDRSLGVLRRELRCCLPEAGRFGVVLEFDLPGGGGRRPDLILLENGVVMVVEFKNRVQAEPADIDQILGYVHHLADYHAGCRERTLLPVLVPVGMAGDPFECRGVRVVPPQGLGALVRDLARRGAGRHADAAAWAAAPYEPLPSLVEAARLLFERQPLPRIRRAEAAGIPEVVGFIEDFLRRGIEERRRRLVFLTGVPGSGKTLVGLQLAYSRTLGVPALFLSGNGPLVQVLQYALKSRVFVRDIRSYLREEIRSGRARFREQVVIFDEAQRAWDRDRVLEKHEGAFVGSEPELLVRVASRARGGFGLVALVGEGQEIHTGEEGGLGLWIEALRSADGWDVLGPSHFAAAFRTAGLPYQPSERLNLTFSLRSHRASDTALWAGLLLEGKLTEARRVADQLREQGFALYASRNLELLRGYARVRFSDDPARRYGLLASSKFRTSAAWGVRGVRHPYWHYGEWFEAPPGDPLSCCRLESAVSEFGCQGLELDFPIVCWGPDLRWNGRIWEAQVRRSRARDPLRLRRNAYRVLLTRGREGLAVFVPPEERMDSTFEALRAGGCELPGEQARAPSRPEGGPPGAHGGGDPPARLRS